MKKLFILLAFSGSAALSLAQDIITLKNGNEIQALVQEIGTDEVKYKKFDNQNGPLYTLKKSEIFMIKYAGGSKDVFTGNVITDNMVAAGGVQSNIEQMKKEFYIIGTDDNRMLNFLKQYDAGFYNSFYAACMQRNRGRGLLAGGLILSGAGIVVAVTGANASEGSIVALGLLTASVGEILTIVSIPVSAGAGARKARIKRNFENQYLQGRNFGYEPSLNFGLTQGGVGLTLNF